MSPLRERPWDGVFIVCCSIFACTSLLFDAMPLLVGALSGDALDWPLAPAGLQTYVAMDPLLVADPVFLRVGVAWSAFVWGPIYAYLARGFYRGDPGIRIPGLMYGAGMIVSMSMVIGEELFSTVPGWRTPSPGLFLAVNLPYPLLALAVILRLRRPSPFGGAAPAPD